MRVGEEIATHLGVEFLHGRVREGGVAKAAAGLGDRFQGLGTWWWFEKNELSERLEIGTG
jgi:hypothetical protein|tara:strand:+ start:1535 stop:1714 length:180 start_codon:yes stop_codon:yes gene_type:complete